MPVVAELRTLGRSSGFRRLVAVRLCSQGGDGLFQVGLATMLFFSPESRGTAGQIAAAFAILLAPFTLVGPWAGSLLDRWRRRQVLVAGNALRAALALSVAAVMAVSSPGPLLYALALGCLTLNRFVLAALSAGLPRVVDAPLLLAANTVVPTLGSIATGLGAGLGALLGIGLPERGLADVAAVVCAAALFLASSATALLLGRDQLGPERPSDPPGPDGPVATGSRGEADSSQRHRVRAAATREALDAVRHLARRRTPGQALLAMAVHRCLFGLMFVASVLVCRNLLAPAGDPDHGMALFAGVLAAAAVGFGLAVLATLALSRRTGPQRWAALCLALGAIGQGILLAGPSRTTLLAAALVLGFAVQGTKIAVDVVVQRDTADAYRGRAFALYDVLYTTAFLLAAVVAAVALPDTGHSDAVIAAVGAGYLLAAAAMGLLAARTPVRTGPDAPPTTPGAPAGRPPRPADRAPSAAPADARRPGPPRDPGGCPGSP